MAPKATSSFPSIYHIRKYGAKPYTPISGNYHTRKLLDTFLSLSNDFKLRDMSSVYKDRFLNFEALFKAVYILWLINVIK